MSVSFRRISFSHLAAVLISGAMIVSADACYHASSAAPRPAVVEPLGQRLQSTNEGKLRRFAGVDVVPTGHSAFVIRIHSAMVGDGEPLYVIDGTQMMITPNRGIDWFKPEDIAQIKVLKYPDELTVYGPRGVNGVILITTKQAAGRSLER
jgi:TonB-dependent SusC/RagA subfamily outer membrane receptor